MEATPGFEPGDQGFADPCLTTWLCRLKFNTSVLKNKIKSHSKMVPKAGLEPARYCYRGILSPLCLPIPPPGQTK